MSLFLNFAYNFNTKMNVPTTEQENPNTAKIGEVSTFEAVQLINEEDKKIAYAVEKTLPQIAAAVDKIVERIENGGRLFYIGTGTSGRLGVLDASEIPPTYGVSGDLVNGVIAGGYEALYKAVEAAEDDHEAGKIDLQKQGVTEKDAVIGIAASGRTPYTIGALEFAKKRGCFTAAITCNADSPVTKSCDVPIVAVVGAEAVTGSTRMKAGTAQKMILNLISTTVMIKLGYVKGNRMTNLKPRNQKLIDRSLRILMKESDLTEKEARKLFDSAKKDLRIALVMYRANVGFQTAEKFLQAANYNIEKAVARIDTTS